MVTEGAAVGNALFDWFWKGAAGLGASVAVAKLGWMAFQKLSAQSSLLTTEAGSREDVIKTLSDQVTSLYGQLADLDKKVKQLQSQSDDDIKKRRELEQANFEQGLRIQRLEAQIRGANLEPVE